MTDRRLRLVLRLNALNSAVCGLLLLVFADPLADLLDVEHSGWVRVVGAGLVPFGAFVAWVAAGDRVRRRQHVPGIMLGDLGWVLASAATLVAGWFSGVGVALVVAMAIAVDTFALLQWRGWRMLSSAS